MKNYTILILLGLLNSNFALAGKDLETRRAAALKKKTQNNALLAKELLRGTFSKKEERKEEESIEGLEKAFSALQIKALGENDDIWRKEEEAAALRAAREAEARKVAREKEEAVLREAEARKVAREKEEEALRDAALRDEESRKGFRKKSRYQEIVCKKEEEARREEEEEALREAEARKVAHEKKERRREENMRIWNAKVAFQKASKEEIIQAYLEKKWLIDVELNRLGEIENMINQYGENRKKALNSQNSEEDLKKLEEMSNARVNHFKVAFIECEINKLDGKYDINEYLKGLHWDRKSEINRAIEEGREIVKTIKSNIKKHTEVTGEQSEEK